MLGGWCGEMSIGSSTTAQSRFHRCSKNSLFSKPGYVMDAVEHLHRSALLLVTGASPIVRLRATEVARLG